MDPGSPQVGLGTKVQVELVGLDGTAEPAEFILVTSKQADLRAGLLDEAAEQRRRAVRKAAAQSEITSQMIFATASGSKWGEYDVDVEKWIADRPEENAEDAPGESK